MCSATGKPFSKTYPQKNKAGNRTYREDDITLILKLKHLVQEKKYSTAGAKKIIEGDNPEQAMETKQKLSAEMQKDLNEVKLFLNKLLEKL